MPLRRILLLPEPQQPFAEGGRRDGEPAKYSRSIVGSEGEENDDDVTTPDAVSIPARSMNMAIEKVPGSRLWGCNHSTLVSAVPRGETPPLAE